ncbi:hypothetical protein BCV69DRAFT_71933 [Microstroma glucosiphilum]|uniref:Vacuolar membrane protein n=1 Tax=Pseudomicrostroma glucosiphilum TaxID=1684307 RepID=A0A316TYW1_9BASI|nr:hypothetical protein BCV69DRAFT_71933 [Pseudomicrostroma glucosiphilum]PWN18402.1 hypothetical protein BCV69DRAFT_71933 [Pseudomicrostroma glucosiphilum]
MDTLATLSSSVASASTSALASPSATPSPVIDHPDVDNGNCRLLGPFALILQGLMGIMVMGTLVWKRQREKPRRPWKIWILDITKQMLGQLFVHILNVALSTLVAHVGEENPCSLYFLNILIDTTLGVFIIYLTLRLTTHVLTDVWGLKGFVSGRYTDRSPKRAGRSKKGGRPKVAYWFRQLGMYFFALLVMKVIVTILFVLFPFLFALGRWILSLFGEAKNIQVLFVMCLFPLAMNTLQFWLVDSFLRHDPVKSKYSATRNGQEEDEGTQSANSSGIPAWGWSSSNNPSGGGDSPYQVGEDDESHDHLVDGLSEDEDDDEDVENDEEGHKRRNSVRRDVPQAQRQHLGLNEEPSKARLRSAPMSRTTSPSGTGSETEQHAYPPSDAASLNERDAPGGSSTRASSHSRGPSRVNSPASAGSTRGGR